MLTARIFRKKAWAAYLVLAICLVAAVASAAEPANLAPNGDFEKGIEQWLPYYHNRGKASALTQVDDAHGGALALRVQTPGERSLEGAVTTVRKLQPGTRYRIEAWVKGKGRIMLCANSGGWTYGKKTNLTDSWQKLEIEIVAKADRSSLNVITVSDKGPAAVFIIDDVVVAPAMTGPPAPAKDVAPLWFEAEDYKANAKIVADAQASGGKCAEGKRNYVFMMDVPFPQTSKLVYVYVRTHFNRDADKQTIGVRRGKQVVQTAKIPAAGKWVWVRFTPGLSYQEFDETFRINHVGPSQEAVGRVDGCVVTTRGDLSDEQLEALTGKPQARGAMVGATRVAQAPVIDGKLDEAAWQRAVEVAPFLIVRGDERAREWSSARILYDDARLYVGFRCQADCLDPVNNRLDAFRSEVNDADAPALFKDDFVALLIDTDGDGKAFYDIFANANGLLNDARCQGPDFWGERDTAWNSKAKEAVHIGKGFWSIELAVPFASLGGPPSSEALWRICLGRRNQALGESSSWMPLSTGFHNAEDMGTLVFRDAAVGLADLNLGGFVRGDNAASARVFSDRGGANFRLRVELTTPDGKTQAVSVFDTIEDARRVEIPYRIESDGQVVARVSFCDPATLATWYRSPSYAFAVRSTSLEPDLEGADWRLYVNGRPAPEGAPLRSGLNVIAIETGGPLAGRFAVGNETFALDDGWRAVAQAPSGWMNPDFDDSGWEAVGKNGWSGGKAVLRKRLLVASSQFWPNWSKGGLSIAQGTVQQLFFVPSGAEDCLLRDFVLTLETPPAIEVLGASGYYGNTPLKVEFGGSVDMAGLQWQRTAIRFEKPLSAQKIGNASKLVAIALRIVDGAGVKAGDALAIRYYGQAESGAICEVPASLRINVLPRVRGKQPKTYLTQMWTGYLSRIDDEALVRPIVESLIACGCNEVGVRAQGASVRKFDLVDFNAWNIDCTPYLDAHPDHALVDAEGRRHHKPADRRLNHICTTLLLDPEGPAWQHVHAQLGKMLGEERPDHLNWDYESSPFTSYIACFCPRCLDAFREFAKLDAAPARDAIEKSHRDAWMRFMHGRFADLAAQMNASAKHHRPGIAFSVYSGYQSPRTMERYGIDWRLLAGRIDKAMCGYGRPLDQIEDTLEALGDTPLVVGEIVRPYRLSNREYPQYASQATLLRRCIDGTGGFLVYTLTELDGRTFYAIGEISRLVAMHEDFFLKHDRRDEAVRVEGIPAGDIAVFADGSRRLVLLVNETDSPREGRLAHVDPPKAFRVRDFYGEKDLGGVANHPVALPAHGVAAYLLEPAN